MSTQSCKLEESRDVEPVQAMEARIADSLESKIAETLDAKMAGLKAEIQEMMVSLLSAKSEGVPTGILAEEEPSRPVDDTPWRPTGETMTPVVSRMPARPTSRAQTVGGKKKFVVEGVTILFDFGTESIKSAKLFQWTEKERILRNRSLGDVFTFFRWIMAETRRRQWNESTTLIWIQAHLDQNVFAAARRATTMETVLQSICVGVVSDDNLTRYRQSVFGKRQRREETAFDYLDRLLSAIEGFGDDLGINDKDIICHFSSSLRHEWIRSNQFLFAEIRKARNAGCSPDEVVNLIAREPEVPEEPRGRSKESREAPKDRPAEKPIGKKPANGMEKRQSKSEKQRVWCHDCGEKGEMRGHSGCPGPVCFDCKAPGKKRGHDGCSVKKTQKSRRAGEAEEQGNYDLLLPTPTGLIECVWDTGCTAHMIPERVAKDRGCLIRPASGLTKMPNGTREEILGTTLLDVSIGDSNVPILFNVVNNIDEVLICPDRWDGSYKDERSGGGTKSLTINAVPFVVDPETRRWTPTRFRFNGGNMCDTKVSELEDKLVEADQPIEEDLSYEGKEWVSQQSKDFQDQLAMLLQDLRCGEGWILDVPAERRAFDFQITLKEPGSRFVDPRRPLYGHRKELVQKTIREWMDIGLVKKVSAGEAQCISNLTFPPKADGGVRVCLDAVRLNRLTVVDPGAVDTVEGVFRDMSHEAKCFAVLDLKWGFYHLKIKDEDRPKAAFWGPDGEVYWFERMAFGFVNAPVMFRRWVSHLLTAAPCVVYVDDVVVEGRDPEQLMENLKIVVSILKENRVLVNLSKFKIGPRVECLGFVRSEKGFEASPSKVKALREVKSPSSAKELKSVLGLLRYLQKHIPRLAVILKPLNRLTSIKSKWRWTETEEELLREAIKAAQGSLIRSAVNWTGDFYLRHDASTTGIGGYLYQIEDGEERIITVISYAFKDNELRWSVIEKECFSLVYCVAHCKDYLVGHHFWVEGDHKPLMSIAKAVHRGEANGRVHRWFWLLSTFSFSYQWIAGKKNVIADSLSRPPFVNHVGVDLSRAEDKLVEVARFVRSQADVLIKDANQKIALAHQGEGAFHCSTDQTLQNLRARGLSWPGIRSMVKEYVKLCEKCQKKDRRPAPRTPLQLINRPNEPFQLVGADLKVLHQADRNQFRYILVVVDYFSRFVILEPLRSKDADSVLRAFERRVVWEFGVPRLLISDGGGEFANDILKDFLQRFQSEHFTTLPYRPSANGQVERVMEEINRRLRGNEGPFDLRTLAPRIQWSINTAIHSSTGYSPFYTLYGYVPVSIHTSDDTQSTLEDRVEGMEAVRQDAKARMDAAQLQMKQAFDRKHSVKEPKISVGDAVLVKRLNPRKYGDHWEGPAEVVKIENLRATVMKKDGSLAIQHMDNIKPYHTQPAVNDDIEEYDDIVEEFVDDHTDLSNESQLSSSVEVPNSEDQLRDKIISRLTAKDIPGVCAEGIANLLVSNDDVRRSRRNGPLVADLDSRWTGGIRSIEDHVIRDGELFYRVLWEARKVKNGSEVRGILSRGCSAHGPVLRGYWQRVIGNVQSVPTRRIGGVLAEDD